MYTVNKKTNVQDWIAESKKKGYTLAQIEAELKKQGCSTESINKYLNDKKNNKSARKIIILIIALSVLALLVLGVFYFTKDSENEINQAKTLEQEGKIDEALKSYQGILVTHPDSGWANFANYRIGNIYFHKKEYDLAVTYFKKATNLKPDQTCDLNSKLGRMYIEKEDYDTARQYFSSVLAINKNPEEVCPKGTLVDIYFYLGIIDFKKENYEQAIGSLEKAQELNTEDALKTARISYNLGWIYYLNKNYDAAKVNFENYLKLEPHGLLAAKAKGYLELISKEIGA